MMVGKNLFFEANSVCRNVVTQLKRNGHYSLFVLAWYYESRDLEDRTGKVLWIWEVVLFSSDCVINHQLIVKMRSERRRLFQQNSEKFGECFAFCSLERV